MQPFLVILSITAGWYPFLIAICSIEFNPLRKFYSFIGTFISLYSIQLFFFYYMDVVKSDEYCYGYMIYTEFMQVITSGDIWVKKFYTMFFSYSNVNSFVFDSSILKKDISIPKTQEMIDFVQLNGPNILTDKNT